VIPLFVFSLSPIGYNQPISILWPVKDDLSEALHNVEIV
jgi:hypothetical protein